MRESVLLSKIANKRQSAYLDALALVGVVLDDGLRLAGEGLETLQDCGLVVVGSAAGLTAFQQTLLHDVFADLEVEHHVALADLVGRRTCEGY